jgi:hypothetical protein
MTDSSEQIVEVADAYCPIGLGGALDRGLLGVRVINTVLRASARYFGFNAFLRKIKYWTLDSSLVRPRTATFLTIIFPYCVPLFSVAVRCPDTSH